MNIRELHLENFRAFQTRKSVSFSPRVSVIAGVNGRGKTAILDALALILQRLLPQIAPARQEYRYLKPADLHVGAESLSLEASFLCAGIPIQGFEVVYKLWRRRTEFTDLSGALRAEIRNAYGPDRTRSDDAAPIAIYYTTDRAAYRLPRVLSLRLLGGQSAAYRGALTNRTVDYKDFVARFRVLSALEAEGQSENANFIGRRAVEALQRALNVFLEGFSNIRIPDGPPSVEVDKLGVPLSLPQLSDGERSFIAIVVDLSRRLALANPRLDNPLRGAGVALIDELELHLHPKWQLEVLEKLRTTFPNIQFICTTHSPFILQTAREGEIINLDGEIALEPAGRTLEEIARLVMDVTNTDRSPRHQKMLDTARRYLALVDEAKNVNQARRDEIQKELIEMLAPFTDNPAYTALLERKGAIEPVS